MLEPIEIVEYPDNGCSAPVGCAPLMNSTVAVPPESPYIATESGDPYESGQAYESGEAYESADSMMPVPDSITNMSGAANHETASPLTIPEVQTPPSQNPQYQTPQYETPPYQVAQPRAPQYEGVPQYSTPRYQYSAEGMSAGPAPVTQCAPCQECVRLQQDTAELRQHVAGLQVTLESEREVRVALEDSLSVIQQNVARISDDVRYWQNEVRRIDEEAEQQHKEDLKSLEMLSELVSQLPRQAKLPDVDVSIIEE